MDTDFSKITPCGGSCEECGYFGSAECEGCLKTDGRCIRMWEKDCTVFRCCKEHSVKFCGLCAEFPCDWVKSNLPQWDSGAFERIEKLGAEYRRREREHKL